MFKTEPYKANYIKYNLFNKKKSSNKTETVNKKGLWYIS